MTVNWASGINNDGQLGNGTNTDAPIPVQVNNLTDILSVSAGQYHSLFLKSDGTVLSAGNNLYGQLGNSTYTNQSIPVQVNGLTGVTKVSASGYYHSLFLKDDNTFWACGQNNVGQLGNSGATNSNVPVQVLDSCSITTNLTTHNKSVEAIIFPNPSNGFFNLEIRENFSADNNIEVYDFLGNLVCSAQLTTSTHILDLSNKARGIYFYKLINANKKITSGKIIID